jgi:hypothetical protein
MNLYKIIDLGNLPKKLAELFEVNLESLGYKTYLKNLHEVIEIDISSNDIRAISNSNICNLLYLSIQSSRNFSFQSENHRLTLLNHEKFEFIYNEIVDCLFAKLNINKSEFFFQKIPTIRVQYPEMNTSSKWHRDTDFGHPSGEINFWIPLTEVFPSSTLWFRGEHDICPELKFGDALCFDGDTIHGTHINRTPFTRVSIDLRIISKEKFDIFIKSSPSKVSIARNLTFAKDYYTGNFK